MAEELTKNFADAKARAECAFLKNFIIEHPEYFSIPSPKKKVLDVGCEGRGSIFPQAFSQVFQNTEITYLDGILDAVEPLCVPQERKVWANACQLPFEDESFDFVYLGCFPFDKLTPIDELDGYIIQTIFRGHSIKLIRFKTPPQTEPAGWGGRAQYLALKEAYRVLRPNGVLISRIIPEKNLSTMIEVISTIGFSDAKVILQKTQYDGAESFWLKK